jgi:error-prone DNA polymerase
MRRVLCAHLPFFRTERLTRSRDGSQEREAPRLAVITRRSNTAVVVAVSPAALAVGLHPGMTLAQARAVLPSLETAHLSEAGERGALESLAAFAYAFSPTVFLNRPQGLILDITGCERLHGGEEALAARVLSGLQRLGYTARVAVADNPTAALALALGGAAQTVIQQPGSNEQLRALPLAAARLPERAEESLRALGLTRVGELLDLPLNTLPVRFGDDTARRVRQLRGEVVEDFEAWHAPEVVTERLDFTAPTNRRDSLMFVLRTGATCLAERLEALASGARRLEVQLIATEGEPLAFVLDTSRPTADAKGISTLLLARFERWNTANRWYEALELRVPSREPVAALQRALFGDGGGAAGHTLNGLLDELTGRLGAQAVARAELTPHPLHERSFRYVPFSSTPSTEVTARVGRPLNVDPKPVRVASGIGEMPSHWDLNVPTQGLRVVRRVERVTLGSMRDYFLLEDAEGGRHWVWHEPGAWYVPRELARQRQALRALEAGALDADSLAKSSAPPYAELVCATNFSFLEGASHAEDLVERAAGAGLHALAVADRHTLAGVVRAHVAAKQHGVKLIVGTRVALQDGPELCLYAMNRQGYSHLCRLLTLGKRRAEKGECRLYLPDLREFCADVQAVWINPLDAEVEQVAELRSLFNGRLSLAVCNHLESSSPASFARVLEFSHRHGIPAVAVNDVHFHQAALKPLQDVLTCIRHTTTRAEGVGLLFQNAERRLKSPGEVYAAFGDHPELLARSVEIADSCTFSLDELRYEYPHEMVPPGMNMQAYLEEQTWLGARRRYPEGVPEVVQAQLRHELSLIAELGYAAYFLTVYDIVNFARERGILCQGRGSAANSAVCYCLGITSVDPARASLLFERFMSRERREPPDIDVDFEHERREEVIQYVYTKYGRERAGLCATVISYRSRSAIRDVGKAVGLSLDQVDRLARSRHWWDEEVGDDALREAGLDPADGRVREAVRWASALRGYPRHLSQHVGGFVITRGRLDELVPIENAAMEDRTVIEWNKDDIDALGILKVDCLALGMLTAIRKCFGLIEGAGGEVLDLDRVFACDSTGEGETPEARAVYAMLQAADAVGTFQVESRAQMAMLPRLKPAQFYDLVVEVAIVRPGPIQGGMVHPYLRRRNGEEPVDYPHPSLEPVLNKTLGVPLFQEQAMRVAVVAAGFTPGEADELRKAMGGWRKPGLIESYKRKLIEGMRERGITAEYAERVYQQIAGFGEYGFPESHAASFALITFVSAWLKRYYPAAFTAALINSQPMGFYSVSSLVRDAREHGVTVLPPCVNHSTVDCTLEGDGPFTPASLTALPSEWGKRGPSLRLGLRLVRGLQSQVAEILVLERQRGGPYSNPDDLVRRLEGAGVRSHRWRECLTRLAEADALACFGLSRREASWTVAALKEPAPGLFRALESSEPEVNLPAMSPVEAMSADYGTKGLSLDAHPLEFLREGLAAEGVVTAAEAQAAGHGTRLEVAGLIINRQRPSTAGGIVFMTLEDETGTANLVVRPQVLEKYRAIAVGTNLVAVRGVIERQGAVVHLMSHTFRPLADRLADLAVRSRDFH